MKNGNRSETGQVMFMRGCTRLLYSTLTIIRQRERERERESARVYVCVRMCKSGKERVRVSVTKKKGNEIKTKKNGVKMWAERVTMVVIYDRFVFFSVEKFFIPLLYS